jgi:hypothetical protein
MRRQHIKPEARTGGLMDSSSALHKSRVREMAAFITAFIIYALSNFFLTSLVIGLIAALLSWRFGRRRSGGILEEIFAFYLLFPIGISFLYNFVCHGFFGDMTARFIGWQNSPFQLEVAFASLGFAVVGLLAFRGSHGLRIGAVIGPALFLLGAAGGHVYQMIVAHNFAPGNAGAIFYMDIVIPVFGLVLLGLEQRRLRGFSRANAGAPLAVPRERTVAQ